MESWLIFGAQWGSEGKGLAAGYFAKTRKADTVVAMNGRNSGHTVVLENDRKVVNYTLPSGFVSNSVKMVMIGPDSVIDPPTLKKELNIYSDLLKNKRVVIHPSAGIINDLHKEQERNLLNSISSTCQGTGAAIVDKVLRSHTAIAENCGIDMIQDLVVSREVFINIILQSKRLQIEGCQGFDLSINSGHKYPFTTSREINPLTIQSGCGVPNWISPEIIATARYHPIRVGHAFDAKGNKIGDSGPYYDDQRELSWEELGFEEERTTCTNKIRRVFSWSNKQFEKMIKVCNPNSMFLNFVNYLDSKPKFGEGNTGVRVLEIDKLYHKIEHKLSNRLSNAFIKWIGTGPEITDVKERPDFGDIGD